MDMSVGGFAGARGELRARIQSAVIAGAVAGTCLIAVPAGLLERALSSVGLSEHVPALAPPIGWPVRIALALLVAAIAAVLAAVPSGRGAKPGRKGTNIMGWTQSLGLHHLARLARGEASMPDPVAITPAMRAPRFRRSPQEKLTETLARHRADLHPDAPPRAPLIASRDLPAVAELTVVETAPDSIPAPEPRLRAASPIRDTTDEVRPRPLPRAPEPLSDSDMSWARGLFDADAAKPASEEEGQSRPVPALSAMLPQSSEALPSADDSLAALLGRFEQGVDERIALRDAADAKLRLADSIAVPVEVESDSSLPEVEIAAAKPLEEMEMDEALNAALETLKKLSAKANGR